MPIDFSVSDDRREPLHRHGPQVEADRAGAVGGHPIEDRRGDLIAGRELVGEALAGGVEQQRALAANRLGDQPAVEVSARERERGRMELAELEVGEIGARGMGEDRAGADRPARDWSSAATGPRRRRSPGSSPRRGRGRRR